ncbi:exodeoxyribonuclease V subunit alpha [Cardiobacterium valvarum]|uniref:RecBCD enzyme subunit RecD n=1 Tax=Cardiobacterium valvarum F0432 TaxID=797473 RepID=G9ZJN3_9GAMM|nr:exodeoxyribonuclease V subunit alpha [Cardiobacterium valvarum]EHM49701.1 putative exodeoxyribonuclease V, alpha subunit [Cardiobacterium valvarum F0432]
MNALAHYLADRHGCPACGDSLAVLLTALQDAHDNGDTLTILKDNTAANAPPVTDSSTKTPLPADSGTEKAPPPMGEGLGWGLKQTTQTITAAILATLAAHGLIGDGSRPTPLVLHGDRLWYYRNYQNEARLAAAIHARLATDGQSDDAAAPAADPNLRPEQQHAVALARRSRLTLINGGPGTGKTHTLAHLIAAELHEHPARRIALAAPTGKAANRMEESLARATAALPAAAQEAVRRATGRARTLHRLLGIGTNGIPQYHAARHLPYDDIIIDEASMLPLELAAALFAATAPDTRLILLGDADQLAAVEPGAILHDLSHHPALQAHRITLHESARFTADSGIGRLAAILGSGETRGARLVAALEAMTADFPPSRRDKAQQHDTPQETPAIHWQPTPSADTYRDLLAPYGDYLALLQNPAADPQTLLAAYDQYRILCAGHHGALGTVRINAALRLLHQRAHHLDTTHNHYHGLPLMILANDHRQQLYNGDTGICLDSPHGLQLHLPGREAVPLARLNPANLADAYALTIHKSQGSEYARVALALDAHSERLLLSRELLYTGITRSKGALDLYADAATLSHAADTPTQRSTGLAWHLSRQAG